MRPICAQGPQTLQTILERQNEHAKIYDYADWKSLDLKTVYSWNATTLPHVIRMPTFWFAMFTFAFVVCLRFLGDLEVPGPKVRSRVPGGVSAAKRSSMGWLCVPSSVISSSVSPDEIRRRPNRQIRP